VPASGTIDGVGTLRTTAKQREKQLGGVTGKGFRPGQSGNPGGRPKKRPISECYMVIAERPLPNDLRRCLKLEDGATYGYAIALGQFRAALKGDTAAAREIREAIEGKSRQRIELLGEDSGPIKISVEESLAKIREFYGLSPEHDGLEKNRQDDLVIEETSMPSAVSGTDPRDTDEPTDAVLGHCSLSRLLVPSEKTITGLNTDFVPKWKQQPPDPPRPSQGS
jgi:hypothetical protein